MARQPKKKTKTYVIDTNVILHDYDAMFAFDDNEVVLPMIVLEELDKHKTRQDEVGANARRICRTLDELRSKGGSLFTGVKLHNGGKLTVRRIESDGLEKLPAELSREKNDHIILAVVIELAKDTTRNVILVSKDINIRVKCDALGLQCEDYRHTRVANSVEEMYSGVQSLVIEDRLLAEFHAHKKLPAEHIGTFFPNQIVVLKSNLGGNATLTKCVVNSDKQKDLIPLNDIKDSFGLKPRNKEQGFALDLLYDDNIKLVTLAGKAGCGKSLIAIASALDQLKGLGSSGKYDKFIVMRPIQPVGKEIGFLPGSFEEKMAPWIAPIEDGLNFLMGAKRTNRRKVRAGAKQDEVEDDAFLKMAQENGLIEVAAITFMRGRSIPNALILIDEAQNLSLHEVKTLITRAGDGTKIILTGDYQQIDNPHVDTFTNGFSYAIEKFKDQPIAGHVTLIKGERSELASIGADIL